MDVGDRQMLGQRVVHVWSTQGLRLVNTWSMYGQNMVYVWSIQGLRLVNIWSIHRLVLVMRQDTDVGAGQSMGNVWSTCGQHMASTWSIHWPVLVMRHDSDVGAGQHICNIWSTYGQRLFNAWTPGSCVIGVLSRIRMLISNRLLINIGPTRFDTSANLVLFSVAAQIKK
jgi:hypothetical protein